MQFGAFHGPDAALAPGPETPLALRQLNSSLIDSVVVDAGAKRLVLRQFILKPRYLPSQAWDRHRKSWREKTRRVRFCRGGASRRRCGCLRLHVRDRYRPQHNRARPSDGNLPRLVRKRFFLRAVLY